MTVKEESRMSQLNLNNFNQSNFKKHFVEVTPLEGDFTSVTMSDYGVYISRNKWRINKSFIDLSKLETKLNVKFKIIENV